MYVVVDQSVDSELVFFFLLRGAMDGLHKEPNMDKQNSPSEPKSISHVNENIVSM